MRILRSERRCRSIYVHKFVLVFPSNIANDNVLTVTSLSLPMIDFKFSLNVAGPEDKLHYSLGVTAVMCHLSLLLTLFCKE